MAIRVNGGMPVDNNAPVTDLTPEVDLTPDPDDAMLSIEGQRDPQ